MILPPPLQFLIDCCFCPGPAVGDPPGGVVPGPGPIDLPPGDLDELQRLARKFILDTGRTCGDFFKTLRTAGNPERMLAGRQTLLQHYKSITDFGKKALEITVCARIAAPRAVLPGLPVGPVAVPPGAVVPEVDPNAPYYIDLYGSWGPLPRRAGPYPTLLAAGTAAALALATYARQGFGGLRFEIRDRLLRPVAY